MNDVVLPCRIARARCDEEERVLGLGLILSAVTDAPVAVLPVVVFPVVVFVVSFMAPLVRAGIGVVSLRHHIRLFARGIAARLHSGRASVPCVGPESERLRVTTPWSYGDAVVVTGEDGVSEMPKLRKRPRKVGPWPGTDVLGGSIGNVGCGITAAAGARHSRESARSTVH